MAFATDNHSTDQSLVGSPPTIVQEGYVWVMSHGDQPNLIRLGSSLEQPDTLNNGATDAGWRLDYYARVDDRQQAHAAASNFLAPFRRDRHLYETDAVVAATAIENSSVPIQFRKTSFNSSATDSVDDQVPAAAPTIAAEESADTRAARQRAMAKLLFDAEQLLEDSELVTGPISYERTFPSPQPADTSLSPQRPDAIPGPRTAPVKTAPQPEPTQRSSDALTHRSPMNELLTTDGGGRGKRKTVGKPLGTAPATRSIPPAPPTPPRARPAPETEDFTNPVESPFDNAQSLDASSFDDVSRPTPTQPVDHHIDPAPDTRYNKQLDEDRYDTDVSIDPTIDDTVASARTGTEAHDRTILMQMERLIVQREARQNLRAIRNRIGWATVKGIAIGGLLGLLLMLALNVPDEIALLIGFISVGAVLGAGLMGVYQSSRLWSAASHWRRIADNRS